MYEALVKSKLQWRPQDTKNIRTKKICSETFLEGEEPNQTKSEAVYALGSTAGEVGLSKPFGAQMILS